MKALILIFGCFISNLSFGQVVVNSKIDIKQITGEPLVLISGDFYRKILEFEHYNPFKHVPMNEFHGYRIFEFKEDGEMAYEDTTEQYSCGNGILYFEEASWEVVGENTFRLIFKGGRLGYPYVKAAIIYKTYSTEKMTYIFEKIKVEAADALNP